MNEYKSTIFPTFFHDIISYLSGLLNIHQSTQNIPHCTHDIPHTGRYIMMNMGYIMMLVVGWHEYAGGGGGVSTKGFPYKINE